MEVGFGRADAQGRAAERWTSWTDLHRDLPNHTGNEGSRIATLVQGAIRIVKGVGRATPLTRRQGETFFKSTRQQGEIISSNSKRVRIAIQPGSAAKRIQLLIEQILKP